jgi:hypothetical protein
MVTSTQCIYCGASTQLKNTIGNVEVFRCVSCGRDAFVHYSVNPEELYSLEDDTAEVFINWGDALPSMKEFLILRSLISSLRNLSKESLAARVNSGILSLGRHKEDKANDILKILRDAKFPAYIR